MEPFVSDKNRVRQNHLIPLTPKKAILYFISDEYFYFFPGLASEPAEEEANSEDILQDCSDLRKSNDDFNDLCYLNASIAKQSELDDYLKIESPNCFNDLLCKKEAENKYLLSDQSDNNRNTTVISSVLLTNKHLEYVSSKACAYWKPIAREIKINESQIMEIEKNSNCFCNCCSFVNSCLDDDDDNEFCCLDSIICLHV